jgi:hypothetical protein
MEVHQHALLQLGLPVVDDDGVVMSVEAVDEGLDRWFVDVPDVRGRLTWFLAENDRVGVDETESVDDHLAFDGLNGVDDDGY